jgi:hypothetical protein
MDGAWGRVEAS